MPEYFIFGYLLTTTLLAVLLVVLCLLCWRLLKAVDNFSRIVSDNAKHVPPLVERTNETLGLVQTTLVDTQQVLKDVLGKTQDTLSEAHKIAQSANDMIDAVTSVPGRVAGAFRNRRSSKDEQPAETALALVESAEAREP